MSEKDDELSEEELNSLLADLESRAEQRDTKGGAADLDEEEMGDLLADLDAEEQSGGGKGGVATKERSKKVDERLEGLDDMAPDDLPAETNKTEGSDEEQPTKEKAKDDKKARGDKRSGLKRALGIGWLVLRWLVVLVPVAALVWVLGSFLAEWVSAGWLIAVIALVVALGLPALVKHLVGRGKFRWWAGGLSLLLTAVLVVPLTGKASESLSEYGHWPVSAVADLVGWETDGPLVEINAGIAGAVGGLIDQSGQELPGAKELGTSEALGFDEADGAEGDAAEGDEPTQGDEGAAGEE